MCQRYQLSKSAAKKCDEVKQLIKESCDLPPMEDRKLSDIRVEHIPAPSLVGQKAPEKLNQLMEILADKGITRIAVYGMGGSGKTTLVKTLNNRLESSASEFFDMVIWVPVSNDLDMKKVQSRVAERLNLALNAEESTERRAGKLHRVLKSGKRFLLILDDVWEKIDLDIVGIPQGDDQANCKIILTTRSLGVCREMMTDKEIKMELLNEEEAWNLFAQNAGNVVESEDINPLAREIARECGGLPLAIETMGKSMRDKTMIQLWQNALWQLKHSEPHYGSFDKVYLRLKLSYNSLPKVRVLKFLNLSSTQITSLPSSLLHLRELHTLLLRDCRSLENLPPLGGLYKLQVLDLCGTRIRELPKDMGKLIHLRDLNLSHTHHLEIIMEGSISGLSSLEVLDMSFSAYKWDVKRNVEGAAFDELLSLRQLSVLHIRLDTVDCVALDYAGPWFGRLKEYTIRIGTRSCDTNLPTQHDEKRVILRGVDLLKRGLEELLWQC
ncbi:hypothetical protein GBA52_014019 [Prunus armeniaca]|nr:hypothetical protein GBA52_014019 [Prunus armeniaca]